VDKVKLAVRWLGTAGRLPGEPAQRRGGLPRCGVIANGEQSGDGGRVKIGRLASRFWEPHDVAGFPLVI